MSKSISQLSFYEWKDYELILSVKAIYWFLIGVPTVVCGALSFNVILLLSLIGIWFVCMFMDFGNVYLKFLSQIDEPIAPKVEVVA